MSDSHHVTPSGIPGTGRRFHIDLDDDMVWDANNQIYGTPEDFAGLLGGAVIKQYTVNFNDPGLSNTPPSVQTQGGGQQTQTAIPGESLWTPQPGDVLLEAWVDVVVPWNGNSPKMGVYSDSGALFSPVISLAASGAMTGQLRANAGKANTTPYTCTGGDTFMCYATQDGTPTGGDPVATQGQATVYFNVAAPLT